MYTLTHQDITFTKDLPSGTHFLLSQPALEFLEALHHRFNGKRLELLADRESIQEQIDRGYTPRLDPQTSHIRQSEWQVAALPQDLQDRRVEITGPVDRKMVINALNSGARVFMADFEDSNAPTWTNCLNGQRNLYEAVRGTLQMSTPKKEYRLKAKTATLMVRPRGWHLNEKHVRVNGQEMSASLFDFGLYFFHNAQALLSSGTGPYFYLPKIEHHQEAVLWNEVFVFAQDYLSIPQGTIKATVLIETITASFQLEEILFALKDHSAGLNCGRWDYIFSFIKRFKNRKDFVFPNRDEVTMNVPCMEAYTTWVIEACHKRGVHAMGGMAAQIPIKNDAEAHQAALEKVRKDKLHEVQKGHDGTWVAHPALVPIALEVFDQHMPTPNQIEKRPSQVPEGETLLYVPQGNITEQGARKNIRVGVLYLAAWLSGQGAAAINNLMEDAATAEISRTQIWQWLQEQVHLQDGRLFDKALYESLFQEELLKLKVNNGYSPAWRPQISQAAQIFNKLVTNPHFTEFLTLKAYPLL